MALRAAAARAGVLAGLGATLGTTVAACADDSKYFDPEALERGAKALREIQSSTYAKKVRWGQREAGWGPDRHSCRMCAAAAATPPPLPPHYLAAAASAPRCFAGV